MKSIFLPLFFIGPALLAAQTPDSIAIKQVDSLVQISRTFTDQNKIDEALEAITAAETIAQEKIGRESAAYGKVCHNYGRLYFSSQNYEKAEKWYLEAVAVRGKVLGKQNLDYSFSLNNLGNVYLYLRKYDKAELLYLEVLGIQEKAVGKENADYAGTQVNLASVYFQMGRNSEVEPLLLEAQFIFEDKLKNRNHPFYKSCIKLQADLYQRIGQYEKAERLFLEIKTHNEKAYGKEHPFYANSLTSLGLLYKTMGYYERVEPLYLEALSIQEKVFGRKNLECANTLQLLGVYYQLICNDQKAEQMFLESLDIQESINSRTNIYGYAGGLINLGEYYLLNPIKEKEAEALLLKAKAIFEVELNNRNHSYYGNCLVSLARLYEQQGLNEQAEMLYLNVIDNSKTVLGEEHPDYAMKLNNLGQFYLHTHQYQKAEQFLLKAHQIWAKTIGKEHPNYSMSLDHLGFLYESLKEFSQSQPLFIESTALVESRLAKSTFYLSESELAGYVSAYQNDQAILPNYLINRTFIAGQQQTGTLPSLIFNQALFYKGFLLNASSHLRKHAESAPETAEINSQLKSYRRLLATEYAKPINERIEVAALEEKADAAEKELARSVAGYAEDTRQVKWQDVQATLKAGEAAIEFIHFKVNFPKNTDSILYAALVLLPGAEQPQFISLFEAKQLDALLKPAGKQKVDWVNQLYAETGNGQTSLYELLWKPLEPALAGVQIIYFSPAGQLHRLNLGAIAIPSLLRGQSETTTIGERFRLIEMGSTRQLVTGSWQQAAGSGNDASETSGQAMLFGGIQYELDSTAIASANSALENNLAFSRKRGLTFTSTDSTLREGSWKYLLWTKVEVTALDGILTKAGFEATTRKDYEATEEAFKSLGVNQPSPRILHLATHGFFFPDPKTTENAAQRTVDGGEPVFKMSEHPMIRSGLLMAGGNYAWEKGKPFKPEAEDGILTAYEISQMDMSHTELVVLSACETGLGDIQGNEGVYGLQRAFKIAGAKFLIMSLWQVPDFQTQQLMSAFYRYWLQDKMSIPDAFRAAQQAMQEKFKDPFFWAGFVLVE